MQPGQDHIHDFVYSERVVAFVKASNGYCSFLEELKEVNGRKFIEQSVLLLSDVYATVVRIDPPDTELEETTEATVTEEDWSLIYQQIARLLGPYNEYLRPAEEDEFDRTDVVSHTVSEDLADIYQELKDFLVIYSRGIEEYMIDCIWEVVERFSEHWGKKLLLSLASLHTLKVNNTDPEDYDQKEQGTRYDNSMFRRYQDLNDDT